MLLRDVDDRLAELAYQPLISVELGHLLYELALRNGVADVLELGFGHGTSTAYLAAALQEKRAGTVTTIDRREALDRAPNLFEVLEHLGLTGQVRPIFSDRSYTWDLMHLLDRQVRGTLTEPCFDFCFIDGAHTWDADALAFLLVDRLLRDDRWIAIDDVNWTIESSAAARKHARELTDEERTTPQLRKVVELLVRPSGYQLRIFGNYAFAYKPHPQRTAHSFDLDEVLQADPHLQHALAFAPLRRSAAVGAATVASTATRPHPPAAGRPYPFPSPR